MAKKKAGSLSGSMIVRDRGKGGVGFVYGEPSRAKDRPPSRGHDEPRSPVSRHGKYEPPTEPGRAPQRPASDSRSRDAAVERFPLTQETLPRTNLDTVAESGKVVTLYPDRQGDPEGGELPPPDFSDLRIPNADDLVTALRSADIAEAEEVFAAMTGLTHVDVLRLLYGPEGKDLALACRALGMEQLQFVSVYILSRKLGLGEEAIDPRELARIVAFFEATDETEAVAALASWRAAEEKGAGEPAGPT